MSSCCVPFSPDSTSCLCDGTLLFLCQTELFSLTCFPQVLRCFSEWVLHEGTSLKVLFLRSAGAWRSCACPKANPGVQEAGLFSWPAFLPPSWLLSSCYDDGRDKSKTLNIPTKHRISSQNSASSPGSI